jgi:Zn finger protein HypA/HybF involved in hydrogenase expression
MTTTTKRPAPIKVECLECGKKFQTRSTLPSCPKCGSVDVDVRLPEGEPNYLRPEPRGGRS